MRDPSIYLIAALSAITLFSCDKKKEDDLQLQLPADAGIITGLKEVFEGGYIELSIPEIERAETYKWYKDGEVVRNDLSRTLTVTAAGIYTVAGENGAGEGKASPEHVVAWGTAIEPPADAGEIQGETEFLEGESATLQIEEIERAQMYKWYRNGEVMEGESGRTLTVTEEGAYTVSGVNSAGEGKQSPEHIVTVNHLPADAGEIRNTSGIDGLFILETDEIPYAEYYRWYRDDEVITDNDPNHRILAMADEPGAYTVAGVNMFGEGKKSAPFYIGEPEPGPDPIPGMNQFAYYGVISHLDPTDFAIYEYEGGIEFHLLDGTDGQYGTHEQRIIFSVSNDALDGRTIDLMDSGTKGDWWFQYYTTWNDFNYQPRRPTLDYDSDLKRGTLNVCLDKDKGILEVQADMVYRGYGDELHFRVNFHAPLDMSDMIDEPVVPAQITSVDDITGAWYVQEYSANFDNSVLTPVNYSIEISKIDDTTVEISGMNGRSGLESFKMRATLNGNMELEFGVHPEISPSWNSEATTHFLPIGTDFDMQHDSFADLWDVPFPAQKFSRGKNSSCLKMVMDTGNNDFSGTGLFADYVVAANQIGTDYHDVPAWYHIVICGTVWTKSSTEIHIGTNRTTRASIYDAVRKFDTERTFSNSRNFTIDNK